MRKFLLLLPFLATFLFVVWACSDDEPDEPAATNSTATTSSGGGISSLPAAPTNFLVVEGDEELTISWDEVSNAEKYELRYRAEAEEGEDEDEYTPLPGEGEDDITNANFTIGNLDNGTRYEVQVRWLDENDVESAWSEAVLGRPFSLSAPANLAAVPDDEQLALSWNAVEGRAKYELRYRKTTPANSSYTDVLDDGGSDITNANFLLDGLTNDAEYQVEVRAVNEHDQASEWASVTATPSGELQPPSLSLVNDTGDLPGDGLTTDATVRISSRNGATVTVSMTTNVDGAGAAAHTFAAGANVFTIGSTGFTNVNLATLVTSIVPTGNATNVISLTATATLGSGAAMQTATTASATEFTLVVAPTQAEIDGITVSLVSDTGDDNDSITESTLIDYDGMVPDGVTLSFIVTTNGEAHSVPTGYVHTGPTNLSTAGYRRNFGVFGTELIEISVTAKLTRHAHSVMKDPLEYTLLPWPSSITATYTDDGSDTADGVTTASELTIDGIHSSIPHADLKLSAYATTNLTDDTDDVVPIAEAMRRSLAADHKIDMREVKSMLAPDEKILSITLDYKGHTVGFAFNPALQYMPASFGRNFEIDVSGEATEDEENPSEGARGIAITPGGVVLVVSRSNNRVQFYDTNGADTNLDVDHDANSATDLVSQSNFGGQGNANNQFAATSPNDLTVGSDGKIYVADTFNRRVQVFNANFSHTATIDMGTRWPVTVFVHQAHLYVANPDQTLIDRSRINAYALADLAAGSGVVEASDANYWEGNIDGDGVLHAIDGANDRVVAWTGSPTGTFTSTGHTYVTRTSSLDSTSGTPNSLVVGPTTGRLYVSDQARHQVLVLEYDGSATTNQYTLFGVFGNPTAGTSSTNDGEFNKPTRMFIHDGELYILDRANDRIQVFTVPE